LDTIVEMLKKDRVAQVLVLMLVAIVVLDAGFYALRVKPVAGTVASLEASSAAMREDLRAKESEYRLYRSYDDSYDSLKRFKELLPRRSEYTSVLKQVYRLAKDDGMQSTSFGAEEKPVQKEGDVVELGFTMPIKGSYRDVRKFIYDVEASKLLLNINSFGLAKAGDTEDMTVTLGLSTYVRS